MIAKVALCIDSKCLKNPALIGLNDASIFKSEIVKCFNHAEEFREYVKVNKDLIEAWIISADDMEAINLAAGCKKSNSNMHVCLVSFDLTGSLKSRADAAGVDCIMTGRDFCEKFYELQRKYSKDSASVISGISKKSGEAVAGKANKQKAFVLPVLSSSGGSGKSSTSILTAMLCMASGRKTLLVDADFQFGDVSNLLRLEKFETIDSVLNDPSLVEHLKVSDKLPYICAAPALPEYAENIMKNFSTFLDIVVEHFDVVVLNTGSFWNELQAMLLESSSKAIFLVDQRPSSIMSTCKSIELCNRCGIATGQMIYAINKCKKGALYSSIDLNCVLGGAQVTELDDGGMEIDEAITCGNPGSLLEAKNPFVISIWNLLETILPAAEGVNEPIAAGVNREKSSIFKMFKRA